MLYSSPAAVLELKFWELVMCILASAKNQKLAGYLHSLCRENKSCVEEITERNFIYNLKWEEFAKLTGRSLASFERDFVSIFKTTQGRWLIQRKLQYARHLLEMTDKNINELAFDTEFESSSHFIEAFKQYYQLTPFQYK